MSQPKVKTNFKTYEASTRLLAAVIATTGVKLDYAEIAKHVGRGVGVDAINHRFRPIKQLAKMQAACVKRGEDPGELPTEKGAIAENLGGGATAFGLQHRLRPVIQLSKLQVAHRKQGKDPGELPVEKGEIQKLFGESTPKGIEWQFRDIKSIGKAQQEAVKKGENPATVLVAGTPSANRGRGAGAGAGTPGSGATARTPGTRGGTGGGGRKRKVAAAAATVLLPPVESSDENDSDFGIIETPSRRPEKRAATASARKANGTAGTPMTAAATTNATIASPASVLTLTPGVTPVAAAAITATAAPIAAPVSIFGGGGGHFARAPAVMQSTESFHHDNDVQMMTTHGSGSGLGNGLGDAGYPSWMSRAAAANPRIVKQEFETGANSFLTSVNPSFDDGDYEDGEI
ncbi:hypothetical protein F4859DRAFT_520550 [Xylaria cf. heliscus]|nr:hypothetical protein F4859DRAFT_520550 [Xylaria cf. heliscus]